MQLIFPHAFFILFRFTETKMQYSSPITLFPASSQTSIPKRQIPPEVQRCETFSRMSPTAKSWRESCHLTQPLQLFGETDPAKVNGKTSAGVLPSNFNGARMSATEFWHSAADKYCELRFSRQLASNLPVCALETISEFISSVS